jgi:hypothetical protein
VYQRVISPGLPTMVVHVFINIRLLPITCVYYLFITNGKKNMLLILKTWRKIANNNNNLFTTILKYNTNCL